MHAVTRTRGGALLGALALVGGLISPTAAFAADAPIVNEDPVRLETGHIDAFNMVLNEDDGVQLVLKEDVTGSHVLRTPESVELYVKPAAQFSFPDGAIPGLSGAGYYLPLTQDSNLIWPGWDTQGIVSVYPGADTDIKVTAIDGPGNVFVWSQGSFGEIKSLIKGGGYQLPQTISQPYPAHTHANWAFSQPGTYKLTVTADVTATNGKTATSNTATYTIVVVQRTSLTPQVPTQEGNVVTIPSQKWVTYTDSAGTVLSAGTHELTSDLTVNASVALGFDVAPGSPTSWDFHQVLPDQNVAITGLKNHYHQGGSIVLNAVAQPARPDATYEWSIQRTDQSAPVKVSGVNGTEFRYAAEQALDGAVVTVNLVGANGEILASSTPATIVVDDHGATPFNKLTISGVKNHYHLGDTVTLTAAVAPQSVLTRYAWEIRHPGSNLWESLPGGNTSKYSLPLTDQLNGASIRVKLTFEDGREYVVSEPVALAVDSHQPEEPSTPKLTITGKAKDYMVGSVVTLSAEQNPASGFDHYHWFIKRAGDAEFSVISGASGSTLSYTVREGDHDAQIIARVYDDDHAVVAESSPVRLTVVAVQSGTPQPTSTTPASRQAGQSPAPDALPKAGSGDVTGLVALAAVLLTLGAASVVVARSRSRAELN